ncbi:hypothetical protein [Paenibacillus mendelii]|uniref:LURP-one-related family protein n=1 Tax=Paenibacillus mendelii TaxID=206163 RepID=A0ABV6JLP2_9BACL|nr:hypothetical protein [Paenibacillus mendelii]MCQ6563054.1 hypothetical protein [Paenibacillus mendelii]
MTLYFRDNFFSSGMTEIMNDSGETVGELDLKSSFSASLDVCDLTGRTLCSGKFPFFSGRWEVTDEDDRLLGELRSRMSFFSQRYEYDAGGRGLYEINSPAFTQDYFIQRENEGETVATFERTSGWLHSGAYSLENYSTELSDYELVVVVLGVHAIRKRRSNAAAT